MKWFTARVDSNVGKITIDGEIGFDWWDGSGTSSSSFMNAVKALGEVSEIHIDMNSPGGSVSDGLTIANFLRNHDARVVVNVLGQASSIASVMASAADEVRMGLGSYMFVHNPWTIAAGNAEQLRALALDLDTISSGILEVYVARIGEDKRAEMQELISGTDGDGTLLSAEMAIELGLADSMLETRAAASTLELSDALNHAREQAKEKMLKADPAQSLTPIDALALGFDMEPGDVEGQLDDLAEQILAMRNREPATEITASVIASNHEDVYNEIAGQALAAALGVTAEQLQGDLEGVSFAGPVPERITNNERGRILAIVKACQSTNQLSLLEKLVTNGLAEKEALEYISDVAAASDPQIHGSHSPDGGQPPVIDASAIYARRKSKQ